MDLDRRLAGLNLPVALVDSPKRRDNARAQDITGQLDHFLSEGRAIPDSLEQIGTRVIGRETNSPSAFGMNPIGGTITMGDAWGAGGG
jgi:hypothetical protein